MPDKVEFEVNIPQEVSFAFADRRAETSDSGDYVRYSRANNLVLFAQPVLAEKIAALCVGAGVILVTKAEVKTGTPRPLEGLAKRAEEPTFAAPPATLGPSAA